MSDKTAIEWTDATWNPTVGCTKVSPGCDHCYAEGLVNRFAGHNPAFPNRFDVMTLRPNMLELPLRWKRPRRVFVNSLSDLFHKDVPDEYIARVFAVMALSPRHTFQVLTKRHARMRSLLSDDGFESEVAQTVSGWCVEDGRLSDEHLHGPRSWWPLRNVWLGVSVESQQWANIRIPALLDTPAAARFLSCEPLLAPVTLYAPWVAGRTGERKLTAWDLLGIGLDRPPIDWVIAGGESGSGARPMHPEWARALRDQCQAAGVPFLFKQWGGGSLLVDRQGDVWSFGDDGLLHTRETAPFSREHVEKKWGPLKALGKKAAGRELDGRTWDEFPGAAAVPA